MIYVLSGTNAYAFITVTYPAGSSLTCTSGSTTLKAKTTTGSYVFCVPKAGTWTVKATSGTNTASKSVSITSRWQSENVELKYTLILYDGGQVVPWSVAENYNSAVNLDSSGKIVTTGGGAACEHVVYPTSKIDLTKYTKLCAHAKITEYIGLASQKEHLCVLTNTPSADDTSTESSNTVYYSFFDTAEGDVVLDISSITGQYYVGFKGRDSAWVSRVWLE